MTTSKRLLSTPPKGGLVVKLMFGQTSLVFVSCHLAAHAHKLKQRNENCKEILRETMHRIGQRRLDVTTEFDHAFWMVTAVIRTMPSGW